MTRRLMSSVTEHGSAFYIVGLIIQSTVSQSYYVNFTVAESRGGKMINFPSHRSTPRLLFALRFVLSLYRFCYLLQRVSASSSSTQSVSAYLIKMKITNKPRWLLDLKQNKTKQNCSN